MNPDIEKNILKSNTSIVGIVCKDGMVMGADRRATAGYIAKAEKSGNGLLLALKCETDFVGKNADFIALAQKLADTAMEKGKEEAQNMAPELISAGIQKLGENIQLGDIVSISAPTVGVYVHDGRIGIAVGLSGGETSLAKDIAMHIAAMNPEYKTRTDVLEAEVAKVRALFEEEVKNSGKPADIQEKMLTGKIETFFKERTLADQSFIKNPDVTIGKLLESAKATLVDFVRVSVA